MTVAEELEWFKREAPSWRWTWAKTFADFAPHSYVIRNKSLDEEPYLRAFRLSQALGRPRKFYKRINIELEIPDLTMEYGPPTRKVAHTGFKFWPMTHRTTISGAFNVAPLGMVYGEQDAPDTTTLREHPFDLIAGDWEDRRIEALGEDYSGLGARIWKIVSGNTYVSSVLDLGPRAGAALDMRLGGKSTQFYRAVEPSQGMLNQLLFRHQWVRDIHPRTAEEYFAGTDGRRQFHTAVALLGTASYLHPDTVRLLPSRAENVHLMYYSDEPAEDFFGPTHLPEWAAESRRAAEGLPGAVIEMVGPYRMVSVRKA